MFIYIYIRRERVLTISTRFFPSILFFNRLQVIQVFSIGFIVIWRKFPKAAFFCPFIFLRFARDLALESCTVSIFFFLLTKHLFLVFLKKRNL